MRTRIARLLRRAANRLDPAGTLRPGEWNHVAANGVAGQWRIWINGQEAS